MAKKLKDLGGKKYEEFSSISAAQKAGSIYYGKKLKSGEIEKKAAVLSTDLSKGQSLRSFINEKLKGSESTGANYKVKGAKKVRPKLRPKSSIDVLEQTSLDKSKTIPKSDIGRLTNPIPIAAKKKTKVNANPKANTYGGGQRRADSTSRRNTNVVLETNDVIKKTKAAVGSLPTIPFAKALTTASLAKNPRAAAQYHSFSGKEKKLVKTLFKEGLTFNQAVAQVYGG